MATLTVYSQTPDGFLESTDQETSLIRLGSNIMVDDTSTWASVGESIMPSAYESFLTFDTSSIPSGDDVDDVTLSVVADFIPTDLSGSGITFEAFAYDWGASLDTGDWQGPTDLDALPMCADVHESTISGAGEGVRFDWVSKADFISNVNKSGETRLVQASQNTRTESGTFDASEYFDFYVAEQSGTTDDPRLVINHSVGYNGPYQYLRPNSDLAVAGWTDEGGGTTNLYTGIDEETPSDTDYVRVTP